MIHGERGVKHMTISTILANKDHSFHNGLDRNIGSIKIKIVAFQGKSNPEIYLE